MEPLTPLLHCMERVEASDLFLSAGRTPAFRIHGRLVPLEALAEQNDGPLARLCRPLDTARLEEIVRALLTPAQWAAFTGGREINTSLTLEGGGRFRCNVFRQRRTPALAIRAIPARVPSCADLGLPPALVELVARRCGLILAVGPTGSGKSTTLAALLEHRSRTDACHIMTLEDPIEYHLEHGRSVVNQREIGSDTHGYAEALHNALRQSPDVLLIGEIRSRETLEQAIAFADTGHLCLATVHANRAAQSIERLLNLYPPGAHRRPGRGPGTGHHPRDANPGSIPVQSRPGRSHRHRHRPRIRRQPQGHGPAAAAGAGEPDELGRPDTAPAWRDFQ